MSNENNNNIIEVKSQYGSSYVKNYILPSDDFYILIDTGIVSACDDFVTNIPHMLENIKNTGLIAINTHEHWDHIGLNGYLVKERGSLLAAHKAGILWIENHDYQWKQLFEFFCPEIIPDKERKQIYWSEIGEPVKVHLLLQGGEIIRNQNYELEVIHTPGHSPGSICLFERNKKILFSGDTVQGSGFFGNLPFYNNVTQFRNSLERIKKLDPSIILGAHSSRIEGGEVKKILDEGIRTIDYIGNEVRTALNALNSDMRLSDIVRQVCRKLEANYSIHTFFSVLAHLSQMADISATAEEITQKYWTKQKESKGIFSEQ